MTKNILITGATGNISSGIITQLKGSGHRILALVRHPEKAQELKRQGEVELRIGDLEKPWTLRAAFAGADTVWMLAPPGPRAPEQCSNGLWAARQAGVKHVVRLPYAMSDYATTFATIELNGLLQMMTYANV